MTKEQRNNMIATIVWVTGWHEEFLHKCSDQELNKLYLERVVGR